jgi:hypothetical protein
MLLEFLQRVFAIFRRRSSVSDDHPWGTRTLGDIKPVSSLGKRAVTRERTISRHRPFVSDSRSQGIPIPEEFRFVKLKSRLDRLATEAWQSKESLDIDLLLNPVALPASSPDRVIEEILNHVRRVAPGFSVPLRVPRVDTGALIDAGGQFKVSDGWVSVKLANHFLMDRRAVGAILAHEVCHYILENSGIRESNVDENERLTDACMFVCGLGSLFLDGYKRDVARVENRTGHRLGYLTDAEYNFAARYVRDLRSNNPLGLLTAADHLKRKLVARIPDNDVRERLVRNAQVRYPEKTDPEIYELVLDGYEHDRG